MASKFDELMKEESKSNPKKSSNHDVKEIHIRLKFNPKVVERIIYTLIILTLVFFVIRSPFCDVSTEETTTEDEEDTSDDTSTDPPASTGDSTMEAHLSFFAQDIVLENTTSGGFRVKQINLKVVNGPSTFIGKADIFWYDEADIKIIQDRVKTSESILIPAGETKTVEIVDFDARYLNSVNPKETFVIKLYDNKNNLLDSKSLEVTPS